MKSWQQMTTGPSAVAALVLVLSGTALSSTALGGGAAAAAPRSSGAVVQQAGCPGDVPGRQAMEIRSRLAPLGSMGAV